MRTLVQVLVVVGLAAGVGSASWLASTSAQEAAPGSAVPRVGDDEAGRLPPGYTVVVTKAQRSRIYTIQDSYQKQIDDLKKQITQIENKRDAEIAAVIDDEQKKIVEAILKFRERDRNEEAAAATATQ